MSITSLTDETFQEFVSASKKLTLVRFTASWCVPCKQQRKVFEQASSCDKISFAEADVDDCSQAALDLGIKSVPTYVLFDLGKPLVTWTRAFTSSKELITACLGDNDS